MAQNGESKVHQCTMHHAPCRIGIAKAQADVSWGPLVECRRHTWAIRSVDEELWLLTLGEQGWIVKLNADKRIG